MSHFELAAAGLIGIMGVVAWAVHESRFAATFTYRILRLPRMSSKGSQVCPARAAPHMINCYG